MRAVLALGVVAIVLAVGPSSRAGVFPDLPGMEAVDHFTEGEKAATSAKAPASTEAVRRPAPNAGTESTVFPDLPGDGAIPVVRESAETASAHDRSTMPLALLAFGVVVLFTRFLVRLNSFGRRTA
jgi:hypothetical protein